MTEDLGLILPKSFQELEEFTGASNFQVFKSLDMEAINYETNAVHLSAHMFFERTEVKQKLNMILQEFVFKSGTNKKVLKLCTTLNKKTTTEETTAIATSSVELGLVDKFVEVFRPRTRLNKISADVAEKKWSKQWSFMWGHELYNKTVLHANPMFEDLLKPIMKKHTNKDTIKALC